MNITNRENKKYLIVINVIIVILMAVAAIKILFVGYDMDEEYAYSLAYRLLKGDSLLIQMWEPHQTSAIFQCIIMYAYTKVFGMTGVVLFSRFVGLFIHFLLAFLLCNKLSKRMNYTYSLCISGIVAFTIPKLVFIADFSNVFMWSALICMLSLIDYYDRNKLIYMVICGAALAVAVFSYPSAIILAFAICYAVIRLNDDKKLLLKEALAVAIPCLLALIVFILIILNRMSFAEIKECMGYVMGDGSHSAGFIEKLIGNVKSLLELLCFAGVYGIITATITILFAFVLKKHINLKIISGIFILVCFAGQFFVWIFGNRYLNYPRAELVFATVISLVGYALDDKSKERRKDFYIFTLLPVSIFVSVLILSNHPFLVSTPFLIYALVGWTVNKDYFVKEKSCKTVTLISLLLCLLIVLVGNILIIRCSDGKHLTLFDDISLIRTGPAKGIIADDEIVKRYVDNYTLITDNVPANSKVFCMGRNTDIYMFGEYEVCAPSTISTPTYNKDMLRYYEINKDKVPEYIICENEYLSAATDIFGSNYEEISEGFYVHILRRRELSAAP